MIQETYTGAIRTIRYDKTDMTKKKTRQEKTHQENIRQEKTRQEIDMPCSPEFARIQQPRPRKKSKFSPFILCPIPLPITWSEYQCLVCLVQVSHWVTLIILSINYDN